VLAQRQLDAPDRLARVLDGARVVVEHGLHVLR